MKITLYIFLFSLFFIGCSSPENEQKNFDDKTKNIPILSDSVNTSPKSDLTKMNLNGNVMSIETDDANAEGDCIAYFYFNDLGFIDSSFVIDQASDYYSKTYNSYDDFGLLIKHNSKSMIGGTTYTTITELNNQGEKTKATTTNDGNFPISVVNTEKTDSGFYSIQETKGKNIKESRKYVSIRNFDGEIVELKNYSYPNKKEKLESSTIYNYNKAGLQTSSKGFWGDSSSLEVVTNIYDSSNNLITTNIVYQNNSEYSKTKFEYKYKLDQMGNWTTKSLIIDGKIKASYYRKIKYK